MILRKEKKLVSFFFLDKEKKLVSRHHHILVFISSIPRGPLYVTL